MMEEHNATASLPLTMHFDKPAHAPQCSSLAAAHHRVGISLSLSGWRLEGDQIVEFGTVEGLYRCDRSAGGNVVDLVDVESFENEKNTENVENTENNENVNDAEKTGKAPKGGSSG